MRSVIRKGAAALLLIALLTPAMVYAQSILQPPNPGGALIGDEEATIEGAIIDIIVGILLPIAGIIAVLFLIIGGFQYMLAGANEDLAKRGKSTIRNAIVGLIIIILSYAIITIVVNTFLEIN